MKGKAKSETKREGSLHWHAARLLDNFLPCPPCYWTTFPAGGGGENRGMVLKSLGLKSGVPDLLIIYGADPLPPAIRQLALWAISEYPDDELCRAVAAELQNVALSPAAHWIELKRAKTGKLADNQIETQGFLASCGCKVANCENLEQVKAALDEWRIPRYVEKPSVFRATKAVERVMAGELRDKPFQVGTLETIPNLK